MSLLKAGTFVRVLPTSEFRPGQDGMAVTSDNGETVGLYFGADRYNSSPSELGITQTCLVEEWRLAELDLTTIDAG